MSDDVGPLLRALEEARAALLVAEERLEEERRAPADADGADAEPFIGPRGRSPHAREEGDARRGPRPKKECPPINAEPRCIPTHFAPS